MVPTVLPKPVKQLSELDPEGSYTYADYLLWEFQERVVIDLKEVFA